MRSATASKRLFFGLSEKLVALCEEDAPSSLIEQANAKLEGEKPRIKAPMSFENLKLSINNASVGSYDGFRMIVQKQINLNTIASHFYWIGSQVTNGQQVYQYRLILPFDDGKLINVGTNIDCSSVEGEVKFPIAPGTSSKATFGLTPDANHIQGEIEYSGKSSTQLVQVSKSNDSQLSYSYMQSITPNLSLGGLGTYFFKSGDIIRAFGGIYSNGEHSLSAQWDNHIKLLYLRKVNPNRVNLLTDLVIDEGGNSQMSLGAEYTLKQSKLSMSIDSNLRVKSLLEASLVPGFQLQFGAELAQIQDIYRFGFGVVMG